MQLYIWNNTIIFVPYLCCYFVRTTNTRTNILNNITVWIRYIISSVPTQPRGGWGSCSETLPYSKYFLGTDDDGTLRSLCIWKLIKLKFFIVYPYLKLHILFNTCSNGLAIWSGFLDITHIKKIMADNLPFWPPWPSFCPNLAQFRTYQIY